MKPLVSFLVVALLARAHLGARERSPEEQTRSIRQGSKIEVMIKTGEKLTGRMGKMSAQEFDLLPSEAGGGGPRVVPFAPTGGFYFRL
jgi:hypothetical protein